MDLKLRREVPVFKRCCLCLPLRRGLIGWGYARLILNILIIIYLIMILIWLIHYVRVRYLATYMAMVAFIIVDVAFTGLLVFACHTKNFKLLRISYIYSIAWLILYVTFGAYALISHITRIFSMWEYTGHRRFLIIEMVMTSAFIFTTVFIQVYVILLTRSEAVKLQNQSLEMEFVNNAAEAEAHCVSKTEQRCTDNGHTSVQYTDDKHDTSDYTDDGHDTSVQYEPY